MKVFFSTAAAGLAAAVFCAGAAWAQPSFQVNKKVADTEGAAAVFDPGLVNSWGVSQAPGGALWISDNASHRSTLYDPSTFARQNLIVSIAGSGSPSGTVFSPYAGAGAFNGDVFLFVTLEGTIVGWRPALGTGSEILVDDSDEGSVYTGMAIAKHDGQPRIYVADFAHNSVDIYDAGLAEIGGFTDAELPAGFAPFNVQALNNKIYVTFAKRSKDGDEKPAAHSGYVDVFDTAGHLAQRLIARGELNAPWGLMIAPGKFGSLSGDLLVGNFGDGRINAYDPVTGAFQGALKDAARHPIVVDGLWALWPGLHNTVTFTSGPEDETHGLMGSIEFVGEAP